MACSFSVCARTAAVGLAAGVLLLPVPDQSHGLELLTGALAAVLLLCSIRRRTRPLVAPLAIIPCALGLASIQLRVPRAAPPPAEFLRFVRNDATANAGLRGRKTGDYRTALDATARVLRVGRRLAIAELTLQAIRGRPERRASPRTWRSGSIQVVLARPAPWREQRRWQRKHSQAATHRFLRRSRGGPGGRHTASGRRQWTPSRPQAAKPRHAPARLFPGRPTRHFRKARTLFRDRFTRTDRVFSDAPSVRLALSVHGAGLRAGCVVALRLYGHALPRPNPAWRRRALEAEQIHFIVRASSRYHVRTLSCPPAGLRERLLSRVRVALSTGHFSGDHGDALRGMLLGSSKELSFSERSQLSGLGVMHLFAASGLHMMLFFGLLQAVCSVCFGRAHWLGLLVSLPVCFAYLWLLDFPVSLSRAFLFVCLFGTARASGRATRSGDVFSAAVLFLLAWMPRDLFSLSGVLSCAAVGAIFSSASPLTRVAEAFGLRRASGTVAVGVAALAGTTPITLFIFGGHSFLSVAANAILVPAAGLVLPAGLAFSLVSLLPGLESVSSWLAWPVAGLARLFLEMARSMAPFSLFARPGSLSMVPLAGALLVLLPVIGLRPDVHPSRRRLALVGAGIALLGPGGAFVVDAIRLGQYLLE